ncbi:MAG: hypothetical protein KGJ60_13865 [Verrucomicrobiota bacterium]|nr:hypothetical protein [Verrucomicrobiota bacterium]
MKWHEALSLLLIIVLGVTIAGLIVLKIAASQIQAQVSNSSVGKFFGA